MIVRNNSIRSLSLVILCELVVVVVVVVVYMFVGLG